MCLEPCKHLTKRFCLSCSDFRVFIFSYNSKAMRNTRVCFEFGLDVVLLQVLLTVLPDFLSEQLVVLHADESQWRLGALKIFSRDSSCVCNGTCLDIWTLLNDTSFFVLHSLAPHDRI